MIEFIVQAVIRLVICIGVAAIMAYFKIGDFQEWAIRMFVIFMVLLLGRYWLKDIIAKEIKKGLEND